MNAAEHLVQIGMRAVIRDIQEWVVLNATSPHYPDYCVDSSALQAYLLALWITAEGHTEGEGSTTSEPTEGWG